MQMIALQKPIYTDLKVLKTGDTMTGNSYFDGSTRNISVGCNNLGADNYCSCHSFQPGVVILGRGRVKIKQPGH